MYFGTYVICRKLEWLEVLSMRKYFLAHIEHIWLLVRNWLFSGPTVEQIEATIKTTAYYYEWIYWSSEI